MERTTDIQHGRHAVFNLHVHLVFVTKYRRKVFDSAILEDLRHIFSKCCSDCGAELVESDGEEDHVHLLVHYPPRIAISNLVNRLKGNSSRLIRIRNYPSIRRKLWGTSLWSPSYFAGSCGGAPVSIIRQYIEQQNTPDQDSKAVRPLYPRPEFLISRSASIRFPEFFANIIHWHR